MSNLERGALTSVGEVAERVEVLSPPAAYAVEITRAFIDPPAMLPEADAPATVDESDPPSPDE